MGDPLKQLKQESPGSSLLNKCPRQVSFLLNFKIPGSIHYPGACSFGASDHTGDCGPCWKDSHFIKAVNPLHKLDCSRGFPQKSPMCPALQGGNTLRVFSQLKKI